MKDEDRGGERRREGKEDGRREEVEVGSKDGRM